MTVPAIELDRSSITSTPLTSWPMEVAIRVAPAERSAISSRVRDCGHQTGKYEFAGSWNLTTTSPAGNPPTRYLPSAPVVADREKVPTVAVAMIPSSGRPASSVTVPATLTAGVRATSTPVTASLRPTVIG